jgi:WD and tetratricopeptide repeat-containing protein 1
LKKEESSKVENAKPNRISQGLNRRASSVSASADDNATDLRVLLISILSENPKGMNLKVFSPCPPFVVCANVKGTMN